MDAGAVSRLLQKDEVAYILNEEDLRDDMNPLTDKEKAMLIAKWGDKQSLQIQEIIARHQMEQRESISTDILKGSESTLEGFLDDTDRSQDSLDTEAINKDTIVEYNNYMIIQPYILYMYMVSKVRYLLYPCIKKASFLNIPSVFIVMEIV